MEGDIFRFCVLFSSFFLLSAAPLKVHMVDMTHIFDKTTLNYPMAKKYELTVLINETREGGFWLQYEEYASGTHVGTHMDAPSHFAKGGLTIDELPISHFIAPAAVIDITTKAELDPDAEITIEDLIGWETETGATLNGSVILLRSGWGQKWNNRTAFLGTDTDDVTQLHFPGMASEAAQWLLDNRRIFGFGTDTLSLDRGSATTFPTHTILLGHSEPIFGLENVANIEKIPIYGATLYMFPMKMGQSSGAPTRIIATFPKLVF